MDIGCWHRHCHKAVFTRVSWHCHDEIRFFFGGVVGGLILIAVVVIWFSVSVWLARNFLYARQSFGQVDRKLATSYFITVIGMSLLSGCEKWQLDRQMEELCKKDGGVRVYETVKLPPEMFDQNGDPFPGWRGREPRDRLGDDYEYLFDVEDLVEGEPVKGEGRLSRYHRKIIRRSDKKLMGESITYGRSGGDFIAFPHSSSKHCPARHNDNDAIHQVFLKQGA
jgi:hypothetical protein